MYQTLQWGRLNADGKSVLRRTGPVVGPGTILMRRGWDFNNRVFTSEMPDVSSKYYCDMTIPCQGSYSVSMLFPLLVRAQQAPLSIPLCLPWR